MKRNMFVIQVEPPGTKTNSVEVAQHNQATSPTNVQQISCPRITVAGISALGGCDSSAHFWKLTSGKRGVQIRLGT